MRAIFLMQVLFQEAIFRVTAAILHLGNIDFAKGQEVDSSVLKDGSSKFHLEMTAELLMYDACSYYLGTFMLSCMYWSYTDLDSTIILGVILRP